MIDFVREGKVEMTFGDCLNWAGWAIQDAEMRILDGQNIPKNGAVGEYLNNPFRMFTVDNAAEAGVPAQFSKGFGEYQNEYKKIWGLPRSKTICRDHPIKLERRQGRGSCTGGARAQHVRP